MGSNQGYLSQKTWPREASPQLKNNNNFKKKKFKKKWLSLLINYLNNLINSFLKLMQFSKLKKHTKYDAVPPQLVAKTDVNES